MTAKDIKPGMLIGYKQNDHDRVRLVSSVTGFADMDLTTWELNSADCGRVCHHLPADHPIVIITGDARAKFIKQIKHEIFDHLHRVKNEVELIRLIEVME